MLVRMHVKLSKEVMSRPPQVLLMPKLDVNALYFCLTKEQINFGERTNLLMPCVVHICPHSFRVMEEA